MRILGIDPGTAIVGFSIIEYENKKINLLDYGCIYTDKNLPMEERLLEIFNGIEDIIKKYSPEHMAIEELFYFKNNIFFITNFYFFFCLFCLFSKIFKKISVFLFLFSSFNFYTLNLSK